MLATGEMGYGIAWLVGLEKYGTYRRNDMKKLMLALFVAATLGACNDADVVSNNLSTAADNFKINRRIVFYNGITNDYILVIEGMCSLGTGRSVPRELTVTCKTGPKSYKKHFLGISDNVTFFAEQLDPASVSEYHYKVIFKPSVIVPDIEVK